MCYGPAPVDGRPGRRSPLAAAMAAGALALSMAPASDGAGSVPELRAQAAALGRSEQGALLQLYATESSLARARSTLARLQARSGRLARQEGDARRRAAIVSRSLTASRARVAALLRELYVGGDPDLVAVVLGAGSLDEMLTGIEGLQRAATQNDRLAREARAHASVLRRLQQSLRARRRELDDAHAAARAAARDLARAASDQATTVSAIRRRRDLTQRQLATLQERARAAQRAAARLTARVVPVAAVASGERPPAVTAGTLPSQQTLPAPSTTPVSPSTPATLPSPATQPAPQAAPPQSPPPAAITAPTAPLPSGGQGSRTMVVDAVAYHLPGMTASGLPVGVGVVAVDPTVIPLGTRLFVPGYGPAVAADVGTAILGAIIDLWMPSTAQARAWGRRTVTITIFG